MDFASLRAKAQQAATKGQQSATDFYNTRKSQGAARPAPQHASSSASYGQSSAPAASPTKPPARSSTLSPPAYTSAPPQPKPKPSTPSTNQTKSIDWLNISPQEKQAFFSLLDEYFDRQRQYHQPQASTSADPPPPPPAEWARPSSRSTQSSPAPSAFPAFTSFPPPSQLGSAAADFAEYFRDPSSWTEQWYAGGQRMPPVLAGRNDFTFSASMSSMGNNAELIGSVLFSDLSMANYLVAYDTAGRSTPRVQVAIVNRPSIVDAGTLIAAYETHSEAIAQFAEEAVTSGQPVGRGECWDMADGALKTLAQYDVPKVIPSLSRCHGHLIFEGKAGPLGQEGRWRGGDTQIRRGDIVEWRKVTIAELGMPSTAWSKLGDPDHTAVILADATPRETVTDSGAVTPSAFHALEVAEQSQGKAPSRATYDLSRMSAGEMWVYRPIAMEAYLGREMVPEWPAHGMQVVV